MSGISASSVVASAARTTTGNSGAVATPAGANLAVLVNVTAVAGTTPSMTLSVEWSHDGGNTFAQADTADTFTAITAAGAKVKAFPVKGEHFRLVWTITGTTPSFTFAASAYGV